MAEVPLKLNFHIPHFTDDLSPQFNSKALVFPLLIVCVH